MIGIFHTVFFLLVLLVAPLTVHAQSDLPLIGQHMRFAGLWDGQKLTTTAPQQEEPKKKRNQGRVAGQIDTVDMATRTLEIGPVRIEWDTLTRFEDGMSIADLVPGRSVKIKGKLIAASHLRATSIRSNPPISPDYLQLRGTVTEGERRPDGSLRFVVLGVPVELSKLEVGGTRVRTLTRRPDDRRPAEQLTLTVFNRPLTIGGEVSTRGRYRGNFELRDRAQDDIFRFDQKLELELFYPLTDRLLLFVEGKVGYSSDLFAEDGDTDLEMAWERGHTWLYAANLFNTNFSLQIGRQNFQEEREWWWDRGLDALRLHYDRPLFHAELGLAQELAATSTEKVRKGRIDPKDKDVLRLLGHTAWSWAEDQRLDTFFLYHHDHSRRPSLGQLIGENREDNSDANLVWLGAQASGEWDLHDWGELAYVFQGAWVGGKERVFEFDENDDDQNSVESRSKRHVTGWAFDSSLTWKMPFAFDPSLTLGYAFGSGDRKPERGTDRSFRQTGLQDNNDRFSGVDSFRYYGELLRPELSNLHLWTASLGFPLLRSSSVEFVYHFYQQVYAAPFLRDARLKTRPLGRNRTIGQEWNLVLGLEEWEHIEIELVLALFRAGSAFGPLAGQTAYGQFFNIDYNF